MQPAARAPAAGGGGPKPPGGGPAAASDTPASVALLDDLPPGDRAAIDKPMQRTTDQLKRNDILRKDADLKKVDGVDVRSSNLTFAKDTIAVNDHVRIVQLTGGTITVTADLTKFPFTKDFLDVVRSGNGSSTKQSSTVDIGQKVKQTGKPVRIATQKVGGKWYPSLLYTIADNAVTAS